MQPAVVSVNVGQVRAVQVGQRVITTAIWKEPVDERVPVRGVNLDGDDQADRTVHGGPDKAIYSYATEDSAWWEETEGRSLGPAPFGENLSTRGLDLTNAVIGERWRVGSTLLEVCQPRVPCFKLGLRLGDPLALKKFTQARRPGAYLRIIEEGDIGAGDTVEIVSRPDHDVTIKLVSEAMLHDHSLLPRLLAADALAAPLREWAASTA